jgi:hypothetical protein
MIQKSSVQSFWVNKQAVSEEFTSLPALSVVMLGFSLVLIMLAHTYTAYQERVTQTQEYQLAETILGKCTNPNSPLMRNNLLDMSVMADPTIIQKLQAPYFLSNISFILRLHYFNSDHDFPEPPPLTSHRVAVAEEIGVYLNDAQTVPGTLTLILWRTT